MVCRKCKINKNLKKFSYENVKLLKKHGVCKSCVREYRKVYYQINKKEAKKRAYFSNIKLRERNREFLWNYLLESPCVDCGEDDPVVLEFDHIKNKKKKKEISKMVISSHSIKSIQLEIKKCVVRCANCHRRKTSKQFKWHKTKQKKIESWQSGLMRQS